ncbi:hypothetical protein V1477_011027 [Vespula maculifrons]|uniref:Uncharacterized protein n=1 Tax=Vespula maculifrons TaxID=7453 RepID=A0ABD2C5H3_VESMC
MMHVGHSRNAFGFVSFLACRLDCRTRKSMCSLYETGRTSLNQRSNSRLTAYISRWQGFNNFHWEEPSSYLYEGHRMQYVTRTPYGEIEIVQRMRLTFTFPAVKTLQIRQVAHERKREGRKEIFRQNSKSRSRAIPIPIQIPIATAIATATATEIKKEPDSLLTISRLAADTHRSREQFAMTNFLTSTQLHELDEVSFFGHGDATYANR